MRPAPPFSGSVHLARLIGIRTMSTLRLSLAVAIILGIGAPARLAQAQITSYLDNGRHPALFIEPDSFRPDFQFFAPADATNYEFGADADPNHGFFFTYDRVYINVTRPETRLPFFPPTGAPPVGDPFAEDRFSFVQTNPSPWDGDFTWGNRLEMGFIDCEDRGWTMVGWHIDGPNAQSNIVNGDRLAGPDTGADPDPAVTTGAYTFENIGVPGLPNFGFFPPAQTSDLPIFTSINSMKMSSFEIMRIMERQRFHNGGVWEPMIGVRYMQVKDRFNYAFYQRSNTDGVGTFVDDLEFYRNEQAVTENNMLGGQLGVRIFKETGHWNLSTEVRMFAMQNWQTYWNTVDNYIWSADFGPKVNPPRVPQYARQEQIIVNDRASEFVWGGELKMEAAYQLTRDINFRTGFVFIDLGRGVGRGRDLTTNDQDVQMFGMTFGLTINK